MFTAIKTKGEKKILTSRTSDVWNSCSPYSRSAGLYSLLVNYSLWRRKLTQISISKRYELSHFLCPSVERTSGRSSLQWYAGHVGLFLTEATLRQRESAAFYWSGEWDHWAFCARSTQRQDTPCLKFSPILVECSKHTVPTGGTCPPLCKEAVGLK